MPAANDLPTPLKPGDVVMLRSGGPPMTVVKKDTSDPPQVVCFWFHPDSEGCHELGVYERAFPEAVLTLEAKGAHHAAAHHAAHEKK